MDDKTTMAEMVKDLIREDQEHRQKEREYKAEISELKGDIVRITGERDDALSKAQNLTIENKDLKHDYERNVKQWEDFVTTSRNNRKRRDAEQQKEEELMGGVYKFRDEAIDGLQATLEKYKAHIKMLTGNLGVKDGEIAGLWAHNDELVRQVADKDGEIAELQAKQTPLEEFKARIEEVLPKGEDKVGEIADLQARVKLRGDMISFLRIHCGATLDHQKWMSNEGKDQSFHEAIEEELAKG